MNKKDKIVKTKKTSERYKLLGKQEIQNVLEILQTDYSNAICGLEFNNPLELTVSLILAAQCTDKRVNMIRPTLFRKYPDVFSLAVAKQSDVQEIIKTCGFYRNKASNIIKTAQIIVEKFDGQVPGTMEELVSLAGIGRKSANIILQECFGVSDGIAVDTHVGRLSRRIGFTSNTNPLLVEKDLTKKIPYEMWSNVNHMLVEHGRAICDARKPKCDLCRLNKICRYRKKGL